MTAASRPGLIANVLAIAGFVVVIIIIIWGLIHLSTLASPWLSSLFSSKSTTAAELSVRAPESVASGEKFTLNWSNADTSAKGTYSLVYPCSTSLSFKTASATGSAASAVPCGAAFALTGNAITLTPTLSATSSISQPLTVIFIPAIGGGSAQAQGTVQVAVTPASASVASNTSASASETTSHAASYVSRGAGNLSVQIISLTPDAAGGGTVVFNIANVGSGASGSYTFTVYLPTATSYTYYSPAQTSLASGAHIVNTLHFTQAISGPVSIVVSGGSDSDKTNNYATANLTTPYAQQQSYTYPTGQYDYYTPQPYPYYTY